MANEKEVFGLPKVLINFRTQATTAIARSARGIVVMILKNENTNTSNYYRINDVTDIPDTGLLDSNIDLIKKCLLGTPLRVLVYTLPLDTVTVGTGTSTDAESGSGGTVEDPGEESADLDEPVDDELSVRKPITTLQALAATDAASSSEEAEETLLNQADVLRKIVNIKWNYICNPTGSTQDQEDLATWVKSQRNLKRKTFKAVVANQAADDKGIINFTTGNIRVVNPEYTDALIAADGDESQVTVPQYIKYTAAQYTARMAGVLAGLALDRSATYYELAEVVDCDAYEDIDAHINDGELCLFDEQDGNGVKIARACNSLHTFTTDVGQDFRYIKIIEAIDMIQDDIRDTFKGEYVGKVINDYNHKMLFISAIHVYFNGLKGNVLDASETAQNYVDIDEAAQKDYAILHGDKVENMTVQQIREYNTGTNVYLAGRITPVNAMEDLKIDFVM